MNKLPSFTYTIFTIIIIIISMIAVILSPDQIKEYVMFGIIVMMLAINRWEIDQVLKTIKTNTKNKTSKKVDNTKPTMPKGF